MGTGGSDSGGSSDEDSAVTFTTADSAIEKAATEAREQAEALVAARAAPGATGIDPNEMYGLSTSTIGLKLRPRPKFRPRPVKVPSGAEGEVGKGKEGEGATLNGPPGPVEGDSDDGSSDGSGFDGDEGLFRWESKLRATAPGALSVTDRARFAARLRREEARLGPIAPEPERRKRRAKGRAKGRKATKGKIGEEGT